jgi:hypothetical protein
MPSGVVYTLTAGAKLHGYRLHRRGFSITAIVKELKIPDSSWTKWKPVLLEYFERKDKAEQERRDRRPAGRPKGQRILDGYPMVNPDVLHMLAMCGHSIPKAARLIGVAHNTLRNYLRENPTLQHAFEAGAEIADCEVMSALKKRACGMKIRATKLVAYEGAITDSQDYDEELPPDTAAAAMWLINRKRWTRDSEGAKADNKGRILEALTKATETTEEELTTFDQENADASE